MADPARHTPDTTTEGTDTVNAETVKPETTNLETAGPETAYTRTADTVDIPGPDHGDVGPAPGTTHPDLAFPGYTGVAEAGPAPVTRRRGPDPLALVVGLVTLAMAVFAFVGELPDLSGVDPRWLLAGGAALVGLVLLVGSLRGRSGGRRS